MTELDKLALWGTAIVAVVCLIGPAIVFSFAGNFLKCLVVFVAILLVTGGWPFSLTMES